MELQFVVLVSRILSQGISNGEFAVYISSIFDMTDQFWNVLFFLNSGMTIEEMTDISVLESELKKLEKQLLEYQAASVTKFQPLEVKTRLVGALHDKVKWYFAVCWTQ